MSIQVNGTNPYAKTYGTGQTSQAAETKEAEALVQEAAKKEDSFVKSTEETSVTYKPDVDQLRSVRAGMANNISAFRMMVQGLMGDQATFASDPLKALNDLAGIEEVDPMAAFEDGEWGVEATATRILDFAKALAGDDPSKIETLRKAVEDGFAAAEKTWGGKLPDISYKTRERVMQGFDDWAASYNKSNVVEEK